MRIASYEPPFTSQPPAQAEAVWQLTDSGLIYLVEDRARAGNGLLTLIVDDLDRWLAEIEGRGIGVGDLEMLASGVRRSTVRDPEGNRITFGQVPAASD